jgi:anti-anti-sigma regulatory factor
MEIRLELDNSVSALHVVVTGTLDVHNAAAFQQLMRHLQHAGGSGLSCDIRGTALADSAARSVVESVRRHTEEFGGVLIDTNTDDAFEALVAPPVTDVTGPGTGAPLA